MHYKFLGPGRYGVLSGSGGHWESGCTLGDGHEPS